MAGLYAPVLQLNVKYLQSALVMDFLQQHQPPACVIDCVDGLILPHPVSACHGASIIQRLYATLM